LVDRNFLRTATSNITTIAADYNKHNNSTIIRLDSDFCRSTHTSHTMGVPFDYAAERPEHIETILNGLDRYNPETTGTFQDYVALQCENQTYDCFANLALLKLYVPCPGLTCRAWGHFRSFKRRGED